MEAEKEALGAHFFLSCFSSAKVQMLIQNEALVTRLLSLALPVQKYNADTERGASDSPPRGWEIQADLSCFSSSTKVNILTQNDASVTRLLAAGRFKQASLAYLVVQKCKY